MDVFTEKAAYDILQEFYRCYSVAIMLEDQNEVSNLISHLSDDIVPWMRIILQRTENAQGLVYQLLSDIDNYFRISDNANSQDEMIPLADRFIEVTIPQVAQVLENRKNSIQTD